MKKLMAVAWALLLTLTFAKSAHAECDGFYIGLRGGMAQYDVGDSEYFDALDMDAEKLMLSGALGYRYEWFRTELEFVWRDQIKNNEIEDDVSSSSTIKSYSYMWNFYWDILPYHWLSPYINVGIGLTKVKYHSQDNEKIENHFDTTHFTMSIGGGFTIKVTNRWNVDLGYRYYDMGSLKNADLTAQEFYAGVRYVF